MSNEKGGAGEALNNQTTVKPFSWNSENKTELNVVVQRDRERDGGNIIAFSVTRWLDYVSFLAAFAVIKNCPNASNIAKIGLKVYQILNKASKMAKDLNIFAKVAKFCQIWSH